MKRFTGYIIMFLMFFLVSNIWVTAQETSLEGILNVIVGDPPANSGEEEIILVQLTTNDGMIYRLDIDEGLAYIFNQEQVRVTGSQIENSPLDQTMLAVDTVDKVGIPSTDSNSLRNIATNAVSGAQPWVNIMCKFPDVVAETTNNAYIENLFRDTEPGLKHYWRELSYDTVNIDDTFTISDWVTLPEPRSFYVPASGNANLNQLANDCTAAADALVDYTQYVGINMYFNDVLDCCAWGGSLFLNLDG